MHLKYRLSHFCPDVVKPFVIIVVLNFIQQFSGMTVLRAYVVKIFGKIFEGSLGTASVPDNVTSFNETGKNFQKQSNSTHFYAV
jgi:hypothetical protein